LLVRDTLRRIAPRPSNPAKAKIWDDYIDALTSEAGAKVFAQYGIDKSPQRLVFILANMCAETGGLTLVWESMSYSADRLVDIFGRAADIDDDEARRLAHKPEAIGERVYGLGNPRKAKQLGNTQPGDGYRFRGGGFLQTTGRDNYRRMGAKIGEDLENHPELIENPLISLKAACAEWDGTKLNEYADNGSFRACCNGINYGNPKRDAKPIGFTDRLDYLQRGLSAFHLPPVKRKPGALESTEDADMAECGSIGPHVAAIQRRLNALGYPAGPPNGLFGTQTRDALMSFQANNGLATTGMSTHQTRAALEAEDAVPYKDPPRGEPDMLPNVPARPLAAPAVTPTSAPRKILSGKPQAAAASSGGVATLVATVLGFAVTFGLLAVLVGWLPVSPAMRTFADDAATPLMLMGWVMALLAALQIFRGRRGPA
jgi:putative chitinase